ncbi:MAG: hypothetical protein ABJZ55_20670 [Fuerstiella sp.]
MLPCEQKNRQLNGGTDELKNGSEVSVRLFTEGNARFQQFVQQAWSDAYLGKMAFPVWSAEYFDWQFNLDQNPNRRLAAYIGDQLVGVLAGSEAEFRTSCGKIFSGAHYSWLSVSSAFRGHKIAPLLDAARVAHEQSLNSDLVVSYRFHGSKHSLAERPSASLGKKSTTISAKQLNRRMGFWARPLHPTALRKWNHNLVEGWMAQLAAPVLPKVRHSQSAEVRSFRTEDLAACHRLVTDQQAEFVISNHWSERRLQWQLSGHPVSQTVVAEDEGLVSGFVNFHVLPFQGRTLQPIGIIDLCCCGQLSFKRRRQLLNEVLHRMNQQGAILALKSRTADVSARLMLQTGFSPRPADSALVFQWVGDAKQISSSGAVRLLWR